MAKKEAKKGAPGKKTATPSSASPSWYGNKGIVAGLVVLAVIISLAAIFYFTSGGGGVASMDPQECGRTAISYLNANVAQAGSTAELQSVTERNGVYAIAARYQNRNITLYSTKDCNLLFTTTYTMKGSTAATPVPTASATPTPTPEPVRTARPTTELFVMSFCPYGVQAETAMEPVVRLLGARSDIRVRYIATVQGTTLDTIKALHGPVEAKENIRQLCIARYYPSQLWPYLLEFNANCYSLRQNASGLSACVANATRKTGIDNGKIEACAAGTEGMDLMKADETVTGENKVTGSPTVIINGQRYSGQRTPEAYKQAICARFTTPPAECTVNLSTTTAATSGSCG